MNDIIPRHRFTFFGILLVTSILFSSVAPAFGQISIARVFNHPYNGQTWGIHARGNYLYVGNTYGFYTWDITDIENPSLSNSQDGNWVNDVVDINDTYGLVGTQDGLQTLNLSDPGSPTFVGTTAGTYNDQVIVLNNLVYIADRNVGVRIYNIESLPALQLAGTVQLSGALGITFYNNRLYVCTWSGEIVEYDLSVSLTQPQRRGSVQTNGLVRRVLVRDNVLYAANYNYGVTSWDVTTAGRFTALGHWTNPTSTMSGYSAQAHDIQFYDKYLFVGDGWGGVIILDITNPRLLRQIFRFEQSAGVELRVRGNYLLVADYNIGFSIFRISITGNPLPPFHVTYPNGGDSIRIGSLDTIRWETHSPYAWVTVSINYNYPTDAWQTIASSVSNGGILPWLVTGYDAQNVRVRVSAEIAPDVNDISDGDFTLYEEAEQSVTDQAIPARFDLTKAFPNPFNNMTTISFSLPKSGDTRLEIFDSRGYLVTTLVAGQVSAGTHSIQWDARQNASGTYFYRLRSGDRSETRRLVLLK